MVVRRCVSETTGLVESLVAPMLAVLVFDVLTIWAICASPSTRTNPMPLYGSWKIVSHHQNNCFQSGDPYYQVPLEMTMKEPCSRIIRHVSEPILVNP